MDEKIEWQLRWLEEAVARVVRETTALGNLLPEEIETISRIQALVLGLDNLVKTFRQALAYKPAAVEEKVEWQQQLQDTEVLIRGYTKYTPEFFSWASEHGFPPRGPRGSEVNRERQKLLPKLYRQWLAKSAKEEPTKEEKHDDKSG